MWLNGAGTPSAKATQTCFVRTGVAPYLIARPVIRVLYIVGVCPSIPGAN